MKKSSCEKIEDCDRVFKLEKACKYLQFIVLVCTLLTIISGVIFFMIASKVTTSIGPVITRMAAAEEKINTHIQDSNIRINKILNKDIFDVTVKNIDSQITEIKARQVVISSKIDDILRVLISPRSKSEVIPP